MELPEAAESGDRLTALVALRDVLARSVLEAPADKRAPLAARLTDVLEQIELLSPTVKDGDPVDEIAKRRTARGASAATGAGRTAGG